MFRHDVSSPAGRDVDGTRSPFALLSLQSQAPMQSDEQKVRKAVRHCCCGTAATNPPGRRQTGFRILVGRRRGGPCLDQCRRGCVQYRVAAQRPAHHASSIWTRGTTAIFASASRQQEASYVFNAAGQSIDLTGLALSHGCGRPLCRMPSRMPQRTKTDSQTTRTIIVLWFRRLLCPSEPARRKSGIANCCTNWARLPMMLCSNHVILLKTRGISS